MGQNQPFCITHLLLRFLLCFSSPPTSATPRALLGSIYLQHPHVHVQPLTSVCLDITGAEMSISALQHDEGNSGNTWASVSDLASVILLQYTLRPPHATPQSPSLLGLSCSVLPHHFASATLYIFDSLWERLCLPSHNLWLHISYLSQSRLFYLKVSYPLNHCCGSDEGLFFPSLSPVRLQFCCVATFMSHFYFWN